MLVTGDPGPWFNIKMLSYQYRKSHCGDKTILRPSYLHNGISYTGKKTSLYWIRAKVSTEAPGLYWCYDIQSSIYFPTGSASLFCVRSKDDKSHSWVVSCGTMSFEWQGIEVLPKNPFIDFANMTLNFNEMCYNYSNQCLPVNIKNF